MLELGDGEVFAAIEHSAYGSPSWGALSLEFASAVLDRVLPVIRTFIEKEGAEPLAAKIGLWSKERILDVVGDCARKSRTRQSDQDSTTRLYSGDMVVDLLKAGCAWPDDLDEAAFGDADLALLRTVERAAENDLLAQVAYSIERLSDGLTEGSEWYEVGPGLAEWCGLLLADGSPLPVDRLAELPGLEPYPWHKRGLLWYSSDLTLDGSPCGPVAFLRDGWIVADPANTGVFTANKWDDWIGHRLNDDGTLDLGLPVPPASPGESPGVGFRSVKQMSYLHSLPHKAPVRLGSRTNGFIGRTSLGVACRILDMMESWVVAGRRDVTSFTHPPICGIEEEELVDLFSEQGL